MLLRHRLLPRRVRDGVPQAVMLKVGEERFTGDGGWGRGWREWDVEVYPEELQLSFEIVWGGPVVF